jgi:hypothetical protein
LVILVDDHTIAMPRGFEILQRTLKAVGKSVAHRNQLRVRIGAQGVKRSSTATTTAANQAELNHIVASGMYGSSHRQCSRCSRSHDGRLLHERSTGTG